RFRRQVTPHDVIPEALVNAALSLDASLSRADLVFTFGETRDPTHGDYATNLALTLAPKLGQKPRAVAEAIVARLALPPAYVSEGGAQIDKLARSLWARVQQCAGRAAEIPEGGYHGDYLKELAAAILAREGRGFADLPEEEGVSRCRAIAVQSQRAEQDADL